MDYILGRKGFTWLSARILAKEFRNQGYPFRATTKINPKNGEVLVNWGNSGARECKGSPLNKDIITNKFRQLAVLKAAEIDTIKVSRNLGDFTDDDYPLFCRQRIHQAGNDIVIARDSDEVVNCHFYSKFEVFKKELRIHVFRVGDELLIRAFKKVAQDDAEEGKFPIRNLEHGYLFRKVSVGESLLELLDKVLITLGMDFSCVDIGISYSNHVKNYTVIEANSAPSLINNKNSLYWYVENIGKSKIEPWKVEPVGE